MDYSSLEIQLIYCTEAGRPIPFTVLAEQTNESMDAEDYEPESFWAVTGGFSITINGYHTIYYNISFRYLVDATNFLLHSLYKIKNKSIDRFSTDDVVVQSGQGTITRLTEVSPIEIGISFTPENNVIVPGRGNRFFNDVTLNNDDWFKQADMALKEYFAMLLHVASNNESNDTTRLLLNYYADWKAISELN